MPEVRSLLGQKKYFSLASSRFARREPARKDLRVVQDQQVAGDKIVSNFRKDAVFDAAGPAVEDHETRAVPLRCGLLCDERFGKVEIEIRKSELFREGEGHGGILP
jgi:hypothetical protein